MAALRNDNIKKKRLKSLFRQLETYNNNRNKLLEKVAFKGGIMSSSLKLRNKVEKTERKITEIEQEIAELQEIPEPDSIPLKKEVVQRTPIPGEGQDFQKVSRDDLEVPLLKCSEEIPPKTGIPTKGILFTDKDPSGKDGPPVLYLSVYFKQSRFFVPYPLGNEKWLYLEANMRPALNLRIQVRANMRDVDELMEFLHNGRDGWDMRGLRPADDQAGDYFRVWQENDENRLMISTFTPTNAGISIHARFSSEVAKAFADYLEGVSFTKE